MNYIELFKDIPPQIAILLMTMIPIAENRVSIPVALGIYKMSVWQAIFWSSIGDIIAAFIIVYSLNKVYSFMSNRANFIDKIFDWFFTRTERKFAKKYEKWGEIALMIFVAIPLPVTGAWTGSIASFLFGIKPWRALLFISAGVIISGVIISLGSLGIFKIF
ncbi:MAG: small multi-drug export protein [Candidatus Falkowbacteria bacterium]